MELDQEIIRLIRELSREPNPEKEVVLSEAQKAYEAQRIAELNRQYEKKQNDAALTAKQLIDILSELPPETRIFSEIRSNKNPVTKDSVYLKDGKFWIFAELI